LMLVQPSLAGAVFLLAHSAPATDLTRTALAAGLTAFLSASQDILIDSWRIEIFAERWQGAALAATIWGYRAALLVAGSLTLWLASRIGWGSAFSLLAILLAAGVALTWLAPKPPGHVAIARKNFRAAIAAPLIEFLSRPQALRILGFVVLFKLGKVFADTMAANFYKSGVGLSQDTIAYANSVPGLAGTLLGAAIGGTLVAKLGARRALFGAGFLQALSLGLYPALLLTGPSLAALSAKIGLENLAGATADAAFLTFLSSLCARDHTATQYAMLSSLAALSLHTIGGSSGFFAQDLGWLVFYGATMALSLPALLVLALIRPPPMARAG
jgi:PAT family beta-lactamase induction signal transducer AmpG